VNPLRRWQVTRRLQRQFYCLATVRLAAHQKAAFARLWDYVRVHSVYYRERYPDPVGFEQIVPCSRKEMMDHFNTINTAGLDRDTLVEFRIAGEKRGRTEYFEGGYSVGLSSGTSGSRLLTVLSKAERDQYSCLLWARKGVPPGIRPLRVLFAFRTHNPTFTEIGVFGVLMLYVDYTHPVDELVALINDKHLNVLAGPPSLLLLIAREKQRIRHAIRALVSYAEVLDEVSKRRLEQVFNAPVVQIYQGSEGFIGSTCRKGHLHINEDVLLVETLGDPTLGPVKVLLTDLYRRTQPMIRYQMDDLLELDATPCECGSSFRRILRIHGRADDVFVLLNASGEPRYLFPDYVRRAINQASDRVLEYQAIQHRTDLIEIRVLLSEGADRAAIQQTILANLAWRVEKIGAILGEVRFTPVAPERHPQSLKLIRVSRRFPWNL
jgi:putative adenylate-forming enzyme